MPLKAVTTYNASLPAHLALLSTCAWHSAVSRLTVTETGTLVRTVFPNSPREVTATCFSWVEEEEDGFENNPVRRRQKRALYVRLHP